MMLFVSLEVPEFYLAINHRTYLMYFVCWISLCFCRVLMWTLFGLSLIEELPAWLGLGSPRAVVGCICSFVVSLGLSYILGFILDWYWELSWCFFHWFIVEMCKLLNCVHDCVLFACDSLHLLLSRLTLWYGHNKLCIREHMINIYTFPVTLQHVSVIVARCDFQQCISTWLSYRWTYFNYMLYLISYDAFNSFGPNDVVGELRVHILLC